MSKKITFLIVGVIIVALLATVVIYLFQSLQERGDNGPEGGILGQLEFDPIEHLGQIKRDYPEVVRGVIVFLDTKNSLKTTVKADDGKEYVLWPAQPKSVYESFGAKDGGRVELQGRFPGGGKLEWGLIKPI